MADETLLVTDGVDSRSPLPDNHVFHHSEVDPRLTLTRLPVPSPLLSPPVLSLLLSLSSLDIVVRGVLGS